MPNTTRSQFIFGFVIVAAIIMGATIGLLSNDVYAQAEQQTIVVQAGGAGLGAAEALIFAPQSVSVHRGDRVVWAVNGFHNIRFSEEGHIPLALIPGVNEVEIPQINPAVGLPNIDNGAVYSGGMANSGLPAGVPGGAPDAGGTFSLIIDLEPGTYTYLCDVHPGMVGQITVVADDEPVASTAEVAIQAKGEIDAALALGNEAWQAQQEAAFGVNTANDEGVANVQAGSTDTGRTTVNRFFGSTTVIEVGQTVTWTVPAGSPDPHTVTWPPLRGQDVAPIPQDAGPPILAFGPGFTPNIPENGEVAQGTEFNSALLFPGQSFSLTFTEPGAYPYVCNIHPGMEGTVVVLPPGA